MDRLHDVWGWLPAFRAVAEAEHLPTAGKALGVSPSALSRTIRLLEEHFGQPLFDRVGRNLRLNLAGQELLAAVRASMRRVEDVVAAVRTPDPEGPLHLAVDARAMAVVVQPAIIELQRRHPGIVPWVYGPDQPDRINERLLAGELDLALLDNPIQHPEIAVSRQLDLPAGIYCGPGHPLYRSDRVEAGEVLEHDFVGPTVDDIDLFPPDLQPRFGLRVRQMWLALSLCLSGRYLAAFPHRVVDSWPGPSLWRVPGVTLPPVRVFLVTRGALSDSVDPVVDAMIRVIADLRRSPR